MKTKTTKPIRPGKNLADLRKLLDAYHRFLSAFEIYFCADEATVENDEILDLQAAIDYPDQFDGDNRANHDSLLRSYGMLKNLLGERQIQSSLLRHAAQSPSDTNPNDIQDIDF